MFVVYLKGDVRLRKIEVVETEVKGKRGEEKLSKVKVNCRTELQSHEHKKRFDA
jgi:hypothetical protein